jgi:hypothetical protein
MLFYIPKTYYPNKEECKRVLLGSSEGKRPLGRPRRGWEDTTMVLGEIGRNGMDWINLVQDGDRVGGLL